MLDFVTTETFVWTDENVERLKELHKKGLSGSQIGADIGCSRNAVISKIHRLDRNEFGVNLASGKHAYAPRKRRDYGGGVLHSIKSKGGNNGLALNSPRPRREPMTANHVPDESKLCLLPELEYGQCRFPFDRDGQRWFCGTPQFDPESPLNNYCAFHHRLTHQPIDRSKIRSTFQIYERGG